MNVENDAGYRAFWQACRAMTERKSVIAKVAKIVKAEMRRHTLIGAMLLQNGEVDGPLCGMWGTTADPCRQP